jgi:prophage maintenance system killer protein
VQSDYQVPESTFDPTGLIKSSERSLRGGIWNAASLFQRSAYRASTTPDYTDNRIGLRIVREADVPPPRIPFDSMWADPERRAAEWALLEGGKVNVFRPTKNVIDSVAKLADLPPEVFTVRAIEANPSGPSIALSDDKVQYLEPLAEVERIIVYSSELSDVGFERLSLCRFAPSLGLLRITGKNKISDRGLSHLPSFANLSQLAIDSDEITGAGLKSLHSLRKLTSLLVNSKNLVNLDSLRGLQLSDLALIGENVTSDRLVCLKGNQALRGLEVSHTSVDDRVFDLVDLTALTSFDAGDSHVTDAGVKRIARFPRLKRLLLNGLAITGASLSELAKRSSLEHCEIGRTKVTAAGVKKLHAALPACRIESDNGTFGPK